MIIVNADDYGYSHEINIAVKEGFAQGILNRASILMNASFTEEAIRMAFENGYADKIGLHLNLTLGNPLSEEARKSKLSTRGRLSENYQAESY
ncbi:MAG: ChbG/HpnK family deacetylase [Lachnospiraceae bacterium]|nr:ChbG/HpnK family deacetylase [Lachnospiraceae bacterium]